MSIYNLHILKMERNYGERKDYMKETLLRFERMLKSSEPTFFDLDTYQKVTGHYIERGDWEKAFKACERGLEDFPYSLELLLSKVQLLANRGEQELAMEILERATLFHPADIEISYMRGAISNMIGEFEEAIE